MDWGYIEVCLRNSKTKPEAESRISSDIKYSRNPFEKTLELLSDCLNYCKSKPNPKSVLVIINELEKLSSTAVNYLNTEIKSRALNVVLRQKNHSVIEKVCRLYRLEDDSLTWLETAKSLVFSKKFSEACIVVSSLKLHAHFTIEEIVVPLFLQDKVFLIEIYIKDNKALQIQFLKYLDGLVTSSQHSRSLASRLHVPDTKCERLNSKAIGKLISKLLKLYDVPPETCPNLCQVRGMGALKYLVNRKYMEGTLDDENWSDLVLGTVGASLLLQEELVCLLVSYNEPLEALKWTRHFNLQRSYMPPAVQELDATVPMISEKVVPTTAGNEEEEVWELQEPEYLPFRLSLTDIHVVKNIEEFRKCIDEIQNYDIVALDGEWKPSFGLHQEKMSLLQMAVWDCVFLLDILALQTCLDSSHWELLIDKVLCNSDIYKLGFGFSSDLQQLSKMIPKARTRLHKGEKMFDLAVLYPKLELHYPDLLVGQDETSKIPPQDCRGLSELTRKTLGLPLDKSMQFSDWDRRPLREPQIIYAALDAYCLLQIFEVWNLKAVELNQDFFVLAEKAKNSTPIPLLTTRTKPSKESKVPLEKQIVTPITMANSTCPPILASEFKVVVDTMLQGLGKHLRICGIDTVILSSEDHHDQAAKIAQKENRMILTSGAPYQQLKQHVPEGHCLNVPNGLNADEQTQFIFRTFNVHIQLDDIFSRCSVCNGGKYIEIPSADLRKMWEKRQEVTWTCQPTSMKSLMAYTGGSVDTDNGVICGERSIPIGLQKLLEHNFENVTHFCLCATCGKVYWEGSHHGRIMRKLSPVLDKTQELANQKPDSIPNKSDGSQNSRQVDISTEEVRGIDSSSMVLPNFIENGPNTGIPSVSSKKPFLPPPPEVYSSDEDDFDCYEMS